MVDTTSDIVWAVNPRKDHFGEMVNEEVAVRPDAPPVYATLTEGEDQFRAVARALPAGGHSYTLVVLRSLEEQDKLLEGASNTLLVGVPLALLLASLGGYFLARKSLAPVVSMSETAERIGAENLHERLPVANARDELGRLAATLGLSIARLVAEAHGGRLDLQRSDAQGSVFIATLLAPAGSLD